MNLPQKYRPLVSKSILPFYGYETDGRPMDESDDSIEAPCRTMKELWNETHPDRQI